MGKRNRRQKKETMTSEVNANPVPDKSPKITQESPHFFPPPVNEKSVKSPVTDGSKSSKITTYFPKSPEGRSHPVKPPSPSGIGIQQKDALEQCTASNVFLPPLGLLTPDTTPTKDTTHPPTKPLHHPQPASSLHQQPPSDTVSNKPDITEVGSRAVQRLEYTGTASGCAEDQGKVEEVVTAQTDDVKTKKEAGKSKRRSRGRSRKSKQANEVQSPSMTLKDYFPVRRSNRRCKSDIEAEETKRLHDAVLSGQEDGYQVQDILGKGRGVVATKAFKKGDFVVEYHGDHIDMKTAKDREQKYAANPSIGCYMYYFQYKNKPYCVDATAESGRIGRLLNHSKNGNCTTKLISINDKPYLILVAANAIAIGEELVYDYGDRNKESLQSHPWLAL